MPSILITGANRGLGLEFARQYAAAGWSVIGTARDQGAATDLKALDGDIAVHTYDALDDASASSLAAVLAGKPIDIVLINAGISEAKLAPVEDLTFEMWSRTLVTNTYAPLKLAALLKPNLELGDRKTLAAISSLAASTSTYAQPREFAYRASKAALNQLWRNLSVEWRDWGCRCVVLRPGRVQTRMTDFQGDLTPEQSVSGMKAVINNLTLEQSGGFFGYDGQTVPW